jgi:hypothetical protein
MHHARNVDLHAYENSNSNGEGCGHADALALRMSSLGGNDDLLQTDS